MLITDIEYFFLIYLDKPKEIEGNEEVKFNDKNVKCIFTKIIQLNEENEKIVKVFKYTGEIKEEVNFDFSYDNNNYQLTLKNEKRHIFIFDILLKKQNYFNIPKINLFFSKLEQNKIEIYDKMNYFIEALKKKRRWKVRNFIF